MQDHEAIYRIFAVSNRVSARLSCIAITSA